MEFGLTGFSLLVIAIVVLAIIIVTKFTNTLMLNGKKSTAEGILCLTAIETGLIGTFELHVRKDMPLEWPLAETPTHMITMGFDPDLGPTRTPLLDWYVDLRHLREKAHSAVLVSHAGILLQMLLGEHSIDDTIDIVQSHVARISNRLGLTTASDPQKIEQDLMMVIPKRRWVLFSHQIIHHGRAVCVARKPKCDVCSLYDLCSSKDKTS